MSICVQEQYIEIVLDKGYFAVKTRDIYKIIKMEALEEAETPDPYLNHVLYLRSKEVKLISLRRLFDLPEAEYTKATRVIVVRCDRGYAGIVVDQVNKISTYDTIQAAPLKDMRMVNGSFFSGISQCDGKQVGIINMDEVLLRF
ncbi:chemotaxis protein CheW [Paenibacillus radicis (ex Xue et al. 2023)]|uniref:Chemotaxis protein CheW n=1 Tax=Paenibacillus radicis (ex Xue et al. 2023) TaxID=2972489 RepID=A0ABT1YTA7_9BACL|nr:chemotaxis protein CheW [Paenibacillus radicis (ex Xue et al. 2023)]MCR8636408.1 chemotaxis protein CheW [Paenibacillus radicis (ex Xue et al. 2023)]